MLRLPLGPDSLHRLPNIVVTSNFPVGGTRRETHKRPALLFLGITIDIACHPFSVRSVGFLSLFLFFCLPLLPQFQRTPIPPAPKSESSQPPPNQPATQPARGNGVPEGFIDISAVTQEIDGPWRHARGSVRLETSELVLFADELDYNEETDYAEARGNVHYRHFARNEELWASKVEYHLDAETGKFYDVRGQSQARIESRPGVLTSTNPFYFEGKWADRLKDRYILHDGMITNCRLPRPWWTLRGPKFDIMPDDRAIAYRAMFRVRKIPLFYTPYFYKSLEEAPRRSGFLTPNIGNSSRRGTMLGVGYYWAINRSYDATYRTQLFTQRGFAHHVDFRGKPTRTSDFNAIFYGVNDRGLLQDDGTRRKQGGYIISVTGKTELPRGFYGRGELNYLNSLEFRQAFTESYQEAIFSEAHSTGFVEKDWSTFTFVGAFQRLQNFQSITPGDSIVIQKLPEISLNSRDYRVKRLKLPVWVSLESSAALLQRTQPLFETGRFMDRADAQPRIMTHFNLAGIDFNPAFSIRETRWGESRDPDDDTIIGHNITRHSREFFLDVVPPSVSRIFNKKTVFGEQLKHVIEPRIQFRHVGGVRDFERLIRFDETELLTNTTEAEISLTNRLYAKRNGQVWEVLAWQISQRRFFDPDFGGTIIDGQRNVILSAVQLTPYAFLDQARNYSPIASVLQMSPHPGATVRWRTDYDPLRKKVVNSTLQGDARFGAYFLSVGHNHVRSNPNISPSANQFFGMAGIGRPNSKGWNMAFTSIYDFRQSQMQYATTEVAYNTDCCGISIQYRRLAFGTRNENQFRVAFAIANIGSFGTLKRQERLF